MNILFNDLIQRSDAPEDLRKPSLTYFIENETMTYELVDGGPADAIYDLLDGENAAASSSGDIDSGGVSASFDDEFDGGEAVYISDEIDGGHAAAVMDEVIDGGVCFFTKEFEIKLKDPSTINCCGVGKTDSKAVGVFLLDTGGEIYYEAFPFTRNGLYVLSREYENIKQVNLVFSGTHIGRVGTGQAVNMKTAVPKEPTIVSSASPRVTLSGQSILGLGGRTYWRISVDTRYKIDRRKLDNIIEGYQTLSKGYPMFISFDDEKKLPIDRMYGCDTNQQEMGFESSINKPLFSRRFVFEERF
jgi:hypothetical protein